MDTLPYLFLFVLPAFAVVAAAEGWYLQARRGQAYDWRAYFASLGDAVGRRLLVAVVGAGVIGMAMNVVWQHRLTTMPLDRAWSWVLLFFGQEFCYYWMHRADHRIRWMWATHAVHHSTNAFNLAAAYRLGWTAPLSGAALFFAPLVWLGYPPLVVLGALAVNLLYQFWIHTELIGRLGPLEWVLNTPTHHRIHHSRNAEYLDRNYGGVLIVFDRLFGTFAAERSGTPCDFGLVERLDSCNPVRIALHGWQRMGRDFLAARGPRERALALFGPPEWQPRRRRGPGGVPS